jgi:8-oxo-dGTP diphosphatase
VSLPLSTAARSKPVVNVAVAVVQSPDGRVLLAERPRGKASGGYWEFPGGKFEGGETAEHALTRELHEEVGIEVDTACPWLTYEHEYADKRVRLHFFRVLTWHGAPRGREGQRLSWEDPWALRVGPLLPANDRVLRALALPPVYAITNTARYGVAGFMLRLEAALESGVRLIQVRERSMTADQLAQIARRVVVLARRYGARVLINGNLAVAQRVGADGVHLSAEQLMRLGAPPAIGFWAASCHDAAELARAAALGADFAALSQVLPTASHPGEPGMGWTGFAASVRDCPLPVYALGGMKPELLGTAMRHGAHGVALHSGIW